MKIAVVQGGPSPEAEVSRASASAVAKALLSHGHHVERLELGPGLAPELARETWEVVFPVVHGTQGEDGCLQGLLEVLSLPYVGSDVRASAVSADKKVAKLFFAAAGINLAKDRLLDTSALSRDPSELLSALRAELGEAFLIKPVRGGSTLGMSRILSGDGPDQLASALQLGFAYDDLLLIEEFIHGQEVTCAVLDVAGKAQALPPILVTAQATEWLDFQSKYQRGGCRHECPAPLPSSVTHGVLEAALAAHRAVGARDLSRSDFLLTAEGRLVLLEINTLPGMTERSLFPDAARVAGIPFPELVERLVNAAYKRGARAARGPAPALPGG